MNTKRPAYVIKQPLFYKNFQCIGGDCPESCCIRWTIFYDQSEVEKLKNAECSEELKKIIDESFVKFKFKNKETMKIKLRNNINCPFHNNQGLCSIQKELGEEYLSDVCKRYPRKILINSNNNEFLIRTCVISCPHVLSMICSDENSMELESVFENDVKGTILDSDNDIEKNPALKYRSRIFDFFYKILSDKSRSIETSIVLGAMAAQKLDEFINQRKYDRIPDVINALKPKLNDPAQIKKLESVKPNLSLKANFTAGLVKILADSDLLLNVFENGAVSEERYNEGMEKFRKSFNGIPDFMRNIALDLYITNKMPYRDHSLSLFESYCYYTAEIAVVKLLIPAVAIKFEPVNKYVASTISYIDRCFTHNDNNVQAVLEYMRAFKCTTPAYLLGIIK